MTFDHVQQAFMTTSGVLVNDDTVQDIISQGGRYIGQGNTRTVYALDACYVLKVARSDYYGGTWSGVNLDEAKTWDERSRMSPQDYEHLAPVRACSASGKWLVMDRVQHTLETLSRWDDDHLEHFLSEAQDIEDLHAGNIGVTASGRFVCIDYGRDIDEDDLASMWDELAAA